MVKQSKSTSRRQYAYFNNTNIAVLFTLNYVTC